MTTTMTWRSLLSELLMSGVEVRPRDKTTKELLALTSCIPMASPVVTCPERKMGYRFMAGEAAWILSGDNRVSSIAPLAKHITQFSDDGLTYFGAYGPPFVDQVGYVVDNLFTDPMSRQAVMTIWRQKPRATKDVPCTVALQWLCRQGRLNCIATMRSSDAWLGWVYDVFNFSMMSAYIILSLRYRQRSEPRATLWTDVELGDLYLTAGSQHLYAIDWERAQGCIDRGKEYVRFAYRPLELKEFAHPEELAKHLRMLSSCSADMIVQARSGWLKEMATIL